MHMLRFSQERRYFALVFVRSLNKDKRNAKLWSNRTIDSKLKDLFNINNAVFLSHNTLEKNLVFNRT